jgi:hypothetical protein
MNRWDAPLRANEARPLLRAGTDRHFWTKLAALWHRERARDAYGAAGFEPAEARRKANEEALLVARRHGWRGELAELKHELADLLDPKPTADGRRRAWSQGGYWEPYVRAEMQRILALGAPQLKVRLLDFVRAEVRRGGRFDNQAGLYKLAFIIGFTPPIEHLERRNAFIEALSELGHDPATCDVELYRIVFRILRPYTLKPFEARQGFSLPEAATARRRPEERPRPGRSSLARRLLGERQPRGRA